MGDLLASIEEIEIIAISLVALVLLIRFRSRILALLTGDDRLHADPFDGLWFACFRCCGTCRGDWSKFISCCPCWSACGLQHRNLVDAFGRWSGLLQTEICVSNVIVGDLPKDSSSYYYISFEVGEEPPQHTAVSPLSHPKLVKFQGEHILRVRDASLDNSVRVAVKEVHTLGSVDVCELYVRPDHLLEWASQPGGSTLRFLLQPRNGTHVLPSWMLLNVSMSEPWEDDGGSLLHTAGVQVTNSAGQSTNFKTMHDLKTAYPLLNSHGHHLREPSDAEASRYQRMMRTRRCLLRFCRVFVILLVVLFLVAAQVVTFCYQNYLRVLVLHNHGVEFPARQRTTDWVLRRCGYPREVTLFEELSSVLEWKDLLVENSWQDYAKYLEPPSDDFSDNPLETAQPVFRDFGGEKRIVVKVNSTACHPNESTVIQACYNMPVGARKPPILGGIFRCHPWTCRYRMLLVPASLIGVVLLIAMLGLMYWCYRWNIREIQKIRRKLVEQAHLDESRLRAARSFQESDPGCCCVGGSVGRPVQTGPPPPLAPAPLAPTPRRFSPPE